MALATALRLRPHARAVAHDGGVVVVVVDGVRGMPGGAEAADVAVAGVAGVAQRVDVTVEM